MEEIIKKAFIESINNIRRGDKEEELKKFKKR